MDNVNTSEDNLSERKPGEIVEEPAKKPKKCNATIEPSVPTSLVDDEKIETRNSVDVDNITNSLAEKVIIVGIDNSTVKIESEWGTANMNKTGEVVVIQETNSLRNLLEYDSSSDDEDDMEINSAPCLINKNQNESEDSDSESDSDSSESSSSSGTSSCSDELEDMSRLLSNKSADAQIINTHSPVSDSTMKIFDTDNVKDLPSIRDVSNLEIDVEKEEFLHMGHIEAIIETLVTVEAIPGIPAYDLDTCLFVEDKTTKRAIGAIYDVIGPVTSPLYCIRFNSSNDIKDLNLKKGLKVFCAPKSKYTQYVFVSELLRSKGTDASWVDDMEIPPEVAAQMSDDDDMPDSTIFSKPQKRKHCSQERYRRFEENMNQCNTLNSQAAHLADAQMRIPRSNRFNQRVQRIQSNYRVPNPNFTLPAFDPTIPPPGFPNFLEPHAVMEPEVYHVDDISHPLRPPRCHAPLGQYQGHSSGDTNHGPGPSYHPY